MPSDGDREAGVLARIERARRRPARVLEPNVTLAHGAGGKASRSLVEAVFLDAFRNPLLEQLGDQVVIDVAGARLAFTTDAFVVSPIFFPGGDIGDLAVNGTVNDLAVGGAVPLHLAAAFVLEEGFPVDDLRRLTTSMANAAAGAGVSIVAGDTKVVERGKGDGCYVTTTGIGVVAPGLDFGPARCRAGDAIVVSGPIGDHGVTVMLARDDLGIESDLVSDTAPVADLVQSLLAAIGAPSVRMMRDPTRGGVATVLNEIAGSAQLGVELDEASVPVRLAVAGACEILGLDPLYVACEGRVVAVVDPTVAEAAAAAMRSHPLGAGAAVVGRLVDDHPGMVLLRTSFGGTRIVDMLIGDPLPRIC
jgi:hydrogenase expression/formation protein HypE